MTGQRLKDIFESHYFLTVGGSLEEAWVKSMKQAVNEAIDNYVELAHDRLCVTRLQLESIADQLKVK